MWTDWAAEFRADLPRDIRTLIDKLAAAASEDDHSATIRDRLKQIFDLFKVSRYRPVVNGNLNLDEGATSGGEPRAKRVKVKADSSGPSGKRSGALLVRFIQSS